MQCKALRAFRCTLVLVVSLFGFMTNKDVSAQNAQRELVNKGVVGVIGGDAEGTHLDIVADLANALNQGYEMRILPIVGEGSVRNVEDLIFLRGIDLAIVQSDVLDFYRQNDLIPGASSQIRYVARLFDEEVYLLTGKDTVSVDELEGKRVNFGPEGDGSFLTAGIVFAALGVNVDVTTDPHNVALAKLESRDIDAMVAIGGKPTPLLQSIDQSADLHLLDLDAGRIKSAYIPSSVSNQDYPDLVEPGQTIETVAVPAVLAAYNWPLNHQRGEKVQRFVTRLLDGGFERLLQPPFHPKWREVDLNADVPGWQRLDLVERYLASR